MSIVPMKWVPVVLGGLAVVTVLPGVLTLTGAAQAQRDKLLANQKRDENLTTVTKDFMRGDCYKFDSVQKGTLLPFDALPSSSCATDGKKFGFFVRSQGSVPVVEAFTAKEVDAKRSQILQEAKKHGI